MPSLEEKIDCPPVAERSQEAGLCRHYIYHLHFATQLGVTGNNNNFWQNIHVQLGHNLMCGHKPR